MSLHQDVTISSDNESLTDGDKENVESNGKDIIFIRKKVMKIIFLLVDRFLAFY